MNENDNGHKTRRNTKKNAHDRKQDMTTNKSIEQFPKYFKIKMNLFSSSTSRPSNARTQCPNQLIDFYYFYFVQTKIIFF